MNDTGGEGKTRNYLNSSHQQIEFSRNNSYPWDLEYDFKHTGFPVNTAIFGCVSEFCCTSKATEAGTRFRRPGWRSACLPQLSRYRGTNTAGSSCWCEKWGPWDSAPGFPSFFLPAAWLRCRINTDTLLLFLFVLTHALLRLRTSSLAGNITLRVNTSLD